MATLGSRHWMGDFSGQTRRDRQPCEYDVYLPDSLRDRNFSLDGDVAADVADAEAALTRLDASSVALADSEALARLLLRAESVASSRIEGLEIGARRLLRADAARQTRNRTARCDGQRDPGQHRCDDMGSGHDRAREAPSRLTPWRLTVACWWALEWKSTPVECATCRTGSAAADTIPARHRSCHHRQKSWATCLTTWSGSATVTLCPHWRRPQWHTRNSRPSIPSRTATGVPDGPWSTWSFAGVGWDCGFCRLCRSYWRPGRRIT